MSSLGMAALDFLRFVLTRLRGKIRQTIALIIISLDVLLSFREKRSFEKLSCNFMQDYERNMSSFPKLEFANACNKLERIPQRNIGFPYVG